MIFVITVSQWSFIWLRVIKYRFSSRGISLPSSSLLRIPRYNPLRKPALDMFRVNTCAYAREETPPPPLSPFFTSFCLPLTRSTFPLEPVPFFFLLSSLSLSFRASFSNQRHWNYFFDRVQTTRSVSISRSRLCPHPRLLPFFFFFWSNRRKKIRLTWLITGFWSRTVFSTWEKWR